MKPAGLFYMRVTVQDGVEIGVEGSVKLTCKLLSVPISTSDGHPMLLDRSFSVKKMSRLNCYVFLVK